MTDDPWRALDAELECWRCAGRTPTLWWRDDDATRPGPALERLLALAGRRGVPLSLAVVPATLEPGLPPLLAECSGITVLQHGYAHVDHAARDEPGAELGEHRPAKDVLRELEMGFEALSSRLDDCFVPVLVPPWNRIADSLIPALGGLGFRGLSRFAPRVRRETVPGLVCSNCHVDPVNWRAGGAFRGEGKCLGALAGHLAARRRGEVDGEEPTGLLTHHWCHDDALWEFLDALMVRLCAGGAVTWMDARQVFVS